MNKSDNYKQTIYKMVEQWTAKACNGSKFEVKKYILKRRDDGLVYFNYDLSWGHIVKAKTELLPLPLKRLIKPGYMEEFVDKEDDIGYELNEDGIYLNCGFKIGRYHPTETIIKNTFQKVAAQKSGCLKIKDTPSMTVIGLLHTRINRFGVNCK